MYTRYLLCAIFTCLKKSKSIRKNTVSFCSMTLPTNTGLGSEMLTFDLRQSGRELVSFVLKKTQRGFKSHFNFFDILQNPTNWTSRSMPAEIFNLLKKCMTLLKSAPCRDKNNKFALMPSGMVVKTRDKDRHIH